MFANDVLNKEELFALLINELKKLGVKYRKEKKIKCSQEKCGRKRIFNVHLHKLELTDVLINNDCVVQIPTFVSIACNSIAQNLHIEGLFRKAGSHLRQKEIKINLENGLPLGEHYHTIDIANVLKCFFRELPEPLIPSHLQEVLLRSYLLAEGKSKAMLICLLLLPPLTLNTLTFFMQFLQKVSTFSDKNKMDISNLAIVFTPGLMPFNDINSVRFNKHVDIIKFLIQNAQSIGMLPNDIACRLQINKTPIKEQPEQFSILNFTDKKKKKRRSGSLNRMLNGLKKIVGAVGSSSENLDTTHENTLLNTPCLTKSNKKRKGNDGTSLLSSKKKKELLNLLPDGNILPNTPMCIKETKKPRLSFTGRKNLKQHSIDKETIISSAIERRWSVVGSAWTRRKNNEISKKQHLKTLSPVISLPHIPDVDFPKLILEHEYTSGTINCNQPLKSNSDEYLNNNDKMTDLVDYVCVPKKEYAEFKEKVETIEKRISQEFDSVQKSFNLNNNFESLTSPNSISYDVEMSGPENVLHKFEKTIEITENVILPSTDQLAKRLSRDLKIRRSAEQRIMRSPSERKIGSIRRRSREKVRLSRNATWHISSTKNVNDISNENFIPFNSNPFYPKVTNLKRGRPNTYQLGRDIGLEDKILKEENISNQFVAEISATQNIENEKYETIEKIENDSKNSVNTINSQLGTDDWIDGAVFFNDMSFQTPNKKMESEIFATPCMKLSTTKNTNRPSITPLTRIKTDIKTPMLPPKTPILRKTTKTPNSIQRLGPQKNKFDFSEKQNIFSPLMEENRGGRASIAKLRALNAGMVLAKTKLFDQYENLNQHHKFQSSKIEPTPPSITELDNRRQSNRFIINKFEQTAQIMNNSKLNDNYLKISEKENLPNQEKKLSCHKNNDSPKYKKPQRISMTKYPDKRLLENIIHENSAINVNSNILHGKKSILVKKIDRKSVRNSPRRSTTPKIKKNLIRINSPRKFIKVSKNTEQQSAIISRTPLRATPSLSLRQSPRLQNKKK